MCVGLGTTKERAMGVEPNETSESEVDLGGATLVVAIIGGGMGDEP